MDILGGVASISQIVAYSLSTAQCLQRAYKSVRDGPVIYRSEKSNIKLLLDITADICGGAPETHERILPILVDISKISCQIFNLLERRSFSSFTWASLTTQRTLEQAFSNLTVKRQILHLHIGHTNNILLLKLSEEVSTMSQRTNEMPVDEGKERAVSITQVTLLFQPF